jgi:sucrose-phosphate synthase
MYIALISVHGLIRSNNPELGNDPDTGGQIKYILDFARALISSPAVTKVDIFTRLIEDSAVADSYRISIENIEPGLRIVRLRCGPRKYIQKELLWEYLPAFSQEVISFFTTQGVPDVIHSHYADAGMVALITAKQFNIPHVHTSHALGRSKKEWLLSTGMSESEIERKFNINKRIRVEEALIASADLLVASTKFEIDNQYGLYTNARIGNFSILPPGIDVEAFCPYSSDDGDLPGSQLKQTLSKFWNNPEKPFILAIGRPDPSKNLAGLITAYGQDRELQEMANVAVIAGSRESVFSLKGTSREVITELLLLIDKWDLYGKVAFPKHHDSRVDIPRLYRMAAASGGVYVSPAKLELFGLTVLEAAASGLPTVASNKGGPVEILSACQHGLAINVGNEHDISESVKVLLRDRSAWTSYSNAGAHNARSRFSWDCHIAEYLRRVEQVGASRRQRVA